MSCCRKPKKIEQQEEHVAGDGLIIENVIWFSASRRRCESGRTSGFPGYGCTFTFTFMHLADAFIQSDLQCIQAIHIFYQYVCSLGIEPTTFCAANAMLYHWATGTLNQSSNQSRALLMNATLSDKMKMPSKLFWRQSVPFRNTLI